MVVQATGLPSSSSTIRAIIGSFNALKEFADMEQILENREEEPSQKESFIEPIGSGPIEGINLGYTINLYLPATSDIAVFNAIFKSLREHLLKGTRNGN